MQNKKKWLSVNMLQITKERQKDSRDKGQYDPLNSEYGGKTKDEELESK